MNFDKAIYFNPKSGEQKELTFDEFWRIPMLERVRSLSQGHFTFYKGVELVKPRDAVKR